MKEWNWMWIGELSDEVVEGIITDCEKFPKVKAEINFDDNRIVREETRISDVAWVLQNENLKQILWKYLHKANSEAFGFDINIIPDIQYTTYRASNGGKYDWHCDNEWINSKFSDRKLSVVLQLTDPSEYEGGSFEIDPEGLDHFSPEGFSKKGSVIVFPSFLRHRVTQLLRVLEDL